MLVLSRKAGQQIQIGPDITITVVKLSSGGVRLGIEAPPELAIIREELAEQIEAAHLESSHVESSHVESIRLDSARSPAATSKAQRADSSSLRIFQGDD